MSASTSVIRAEALTKTYELFESPWERLRCRLGVARPRLMTAVDEVTFEVARGRSLGIVGENGAGKTTLLRMLTGITRPTSGLCSVRGRVGSILELGGGFHPELTGRQNIRLSAALAGLDPRETSTIADEIIAFAELEAFIDEPVKRYSSGMAVRLAFAIAAGSRPEVLVIDEALAVGDGRFQKKCLDRIRDFLEQGGTLVFCTHSLYAMTSICDEALWLREGRTAAQGSATTVAQEYDAHLRGPAEEAESGFAAVNAEPGDRPTIVYLRLLDSVGVDGPPVYEPGRRWGLEVTVTSPRTDLGLHLAVGVNSPEGVEVMMFSTQRDGLDPSRGLDRYRMRVWLPELPLASGEFDLHVYLLDESGLHAYQHETRKAAFMVRSVAYYPGLIDPPRTWEWPALD